MPGINNELGMEILNDLQVVAALMGSEVLRWRRQNIGDEGKLRHVQLEGSSADVFEEL